MKQIQFSRDSILQILSTGVAKVTFTKKDGSERIMRCTRDLKHAPHAPVPKNANFEDSVDVIRAYDLEAEGWRSFIVSSVKRIDVL